MEDAPLKKPLLFLLPAITVLFLAFLAGTLYGRNNIGTIAGVTTEVKSNIETTEKTVINGKININTATADDLIYVPGIGEVMAQRIIDYRNTNGPFNSIDDIINVDGIGQKKLEQLSVYLTTGG